MIKYIFLWVLVSGFAACGLRNEHLFEKLESTGTGIHFNNKITENDSVNILDMEYVYNGGGVAIADFNNDSLPDVFFTGNMVANQLYLNEGKMKFRDVSKAAGISGNNKWCTGVATIDINQDGMMDLYVCASMKDNAAERANMLFINKGAGKDGTPVFVDEASAYNVADTGHSTTAAFFDYDNDGDLDLYVLTNKMDKVYPNQYRKKIIDGSSPTTDKLYRNDWDSSLAHPLFTDVSKQAGILIEGFGLGLNISDINRDGWKDIYVTNDFLTNDLLWINNRNGTFTNRAGDYFKHTSYSAMGNDVADINNDGLADIITADMLPGTNYRKKMMMSANSYQTNLNNNEYGFEYQYGRNTLQLNLGNSVNKNDSLKHPVFAEIAFYAGVAETDWSWTPMVTDFDNDGFRDLIITNGFPKDITDHDFMTYRANANKIASKGELLEQIPAVKLHNYAFRNDGDLKFSDVTVKWGLSEPCFSNGAAYGDLDNDGDLDFIINNINDEAFVYENKSPNSERKNNHYLQIDFKGSQHNKNGIGAWVELYYDSSKRQVYENSPYRGYLSSVQNIAHFGLGNNSSIDSISIKWPNGKMQIMTDVKTDQKITADIKNALLSYSFDRSPNNNTLFEDVTEEVNIDYQQQEIDFADFNIQKLLPHKLSEYGPGLAVGDIDGDGLDDIICGGSYGYSASVFLQQADGKFITSAVIPDANPKSKPWEDLGVLLFDADDDKDLDLYTVSGSYENAPGSKSYLDKFFVNNGKGIFTYDSLAFPQNATSKSCARAVDFDKDGDLDIFVAGRVEPWNYPKPVNSFIYRNDSKNGILQFTDVTNNIAKDLSGIGLVCDAVWTDFDNDGWSDLILAGEWMSVTFLKNDKGIFKNITGQSGIENEIGFWNSIAPGDFDNDGDIDYIIGNMGQNTFYRASKQYPVKMYAKDFDNNGSYDAIPSLYLFDEQGKKQEYPAQTRDDLVKQIIGMRSKFQNYKSQAIATMDKLFTPEELKDALVLHANNFKTSFIKNNGAGKFEVFPLPAYAQFSTINGMVAEDFDGDGNLDIVMNGNDFGTETTVGRYDALNGLFMRGDGKGNFVSTSIAESGIFIPGNGKAFVKLKAAAGKCLLAGGQNRGALKIFKSKNTDQLIPVLPLEVSALIKYKDGRARREEMYYGASFLSQSGRFLNAGNKIGSIEFIDSKGNKRLIQL
ncbi:MAG: VCBS repeat-containing protein [Chitinophagaceae bacterium]|nr:VCBS repeat-containing protein [Chitinophagaceae bacterium]